MAQAMEAWLLSQERHMKIMARLTFKKQNHLQLELATAPIKTIRLQ